MKELDNPTGRDALTGLCNRQALKVLLKLEYDRARRASMPLSIVAIDLDHFRLVNETFLLTSGDVVITEIARLLVDRARPGDAVTRDGGDQYTLIMPNTSTDEAIKEAERLREGIACSTIEVRGERITVTASFGVASATFTEAEPWLMFERARDAVHRAKDQGRNRVGVG